MKNVIFSVILLIFLSNFLIAAPQPEKSYSNFDIKPHFFTKNDLNPKRNSFIDKYDTNNVPWPIAIDNQRLQIDKKEQKTGYFFQKIRPQTYFSSEDLHNKAERPTRKPNDKVINYQVSDSNVNPEIYQKPAKLQYDEYGNVISTIDNSGDVPRKSSSEYDDILHQFTVKSTVFGPVELSTNYEINYDNAFGAVTKKTGPNGNSTYYEYDELGRLKAQFIDTESGKSKLNDYEYRTNFPLSVKLINYANDEDAERSRSIEGEGDGTAGRKTLPVQNREIAVYADGIGRAIHSINSAGNGKYIKSGLIKYDAVGRVISKGQSYYVNKEELDKYVTRSNQNKYPSLTEFDSSGRVKKVILPLAEGEKENTSISYEYNDPYEVIQTHSVGRSKRTIKNGRGQVLYVEDFGFSMPEALEGGYGGRGIASPVLSASIGFAYDLAGNRIKKMDLPSPAGMDLSIDESLFEVGVKDESGSNVNIWKYDGFGRVIEQSDADLGYSKAVYDNFGELISKIDARGLETKYEYDEFGRVILKILPDIEGEGHGEGGHDDEGRKTLPVRYRYDELEGADNALGKLVKIDDSAQIKYFSYDKIGRIKEEKRLVKNSDLDEFKTSFKYDLLNRKIEIIYPKDPVTKRSVVAKYIYGAMGIEALIVDNGRTSGSPVRIIDNVIYNEFGQIDEIKRGNGVDTVYSYDIKGRLVNLKTLKAGIGREAPPLLLQNVNYVFNSDNSIASKFDDLDGRFVKYNYKYDGLNRLIDAEGIYENQLDTEAKYFKRKFDYSPNGNLLNKYIYNKPGELEDSWNYHYDNHAVQLITKLKAMGEHTDSPVRSIIMNYDAVGNMIYQEHTENDLIKNIVFDSQNRIKKVTDKNGKVVGEYSYDDYGFRVRKLAKAGPSTTLRDRRAKFIELIYPSMYYGLERQLNNHKKVIKNTHSAVNNIYLNGVRIAAVSATGKTQYYLTDQVDSVKVVVDDEGKILNKFEYLPYGETWITEGDGNNSPKYNSQELDRETSFYFYNARSYDPEIARFVTADTVVDGEYSASGWNRYMYVGGNPIGYRDPTGHKIDFSYKEKRNGKYVTLVDKEAKETLEYLKRLNDKNLNKVINKLEKSKTIINIRFADIEARGHYQANKGNLSKKTKDIRINNYFKKGGFEPGTKMTRGSILAHELGHAYNNIILDKGIGYPFTGLGNEVLSRNLENIVRKKEGFKPSLGYAGYDMRSGLSFDDPFIDPKGKRYELTNHACFRVHGCNSIDPKHSDFMKKIKPYKDYTPNEYPEGMERYIHNKRKLNERKEKH